MRLKTDMPCNCDHLMPHALEREVAKVISFLEELDGKKLNKQWLEGYHPKAYGKSTKAKADALTAQLCARLRNTANVTQYSLELQMWWRDHQEADRLRIKREAAAQAKEKARKAAIKKLSKYEQKLLGLT